MKPSKRKGKQVKNSEMVRQKQQAMAAPAKPGAAEAKARVEGPPTNLSDTINRVAALKLIVSQLGRTTAILPEGNRQDYRTALVKAHGHLVEALDVLNEVYQAQKPHEVTEDDLSSDIV